MWAWNTRRCSRGVVFCVVLFYLSYFCKKKGRSSMSIKKSDSYTFATDSEDENKGATTTKVVVDGEIHEDNPSFYHKPQISTFGRKWRLSKEPFYKAKKSDEELKHLKGGVKRFYKRQNELVDSFLSLDKMHKEFQQLTPMYTILEDQQSSDEEYASSNSEMTEAKEEGLKVKIAIYGSFAVNVVLFCLKIYAAVASGSLSVIASALDSFLDLLSGSIIFITNIMKNKKNIYKYPAGKDRLEPLGIIIFSACMFTATIQLITQSVEVLLSGHLDIDFGPGPLSVIIATVALKLGLFIYCSMIKGQSASVDALRQDHRNDIVSNTFGVCTALIGFYLLWYVDPIGGICIGLYIMTNWFRTGYKQVQNLTGKSAPSSFLQQITFLCWNHDPRILQIDTVRAFHLGLGFLVEVDIVLPETMNLKQAHDIGQALQDKLEHINLVERAFVHLDYETEHTPEHIPPPKKVEVPEL